ncbi:hypothetical protein ACFL3H_06780 [Gemmatimonadota bacterium]
MSSDRIHIDRTMRHVVAGVVMLTMLSVTVICGQEQVGSSSQQDEIIDVTSIELIESRSPESFILLIRCTRQREVNWFWAVNTTLVLDVRLTYMPFRGEALGDLLLREVSSVRASQFMEGRIPIARIEVDVRTPKGIDVRWTDEGIEVTFGPPGPPIPAPTLAGRLTPAAVPERQTPPPAAVDTIAAEPESTLVEEAPGRQYEYRHGARINPFDPLLKPPGEVDQTNTLTRPLPDAEQLQLTGISWLENRPDDCVALLRDVNGMNFRLKRGDRVKFGYVSEIGPKEISFVLDIYGRHKVVTLRYNP